MSDTAPVAEVAEVDGGNSFTEDLAVDSRGTSTVTECSSDEPAGTPVPRKIPEKLLTRIFTVLY